MHNVIPSTTLQARVLVSPRAAPGTADGTGTHPVLPAPDRLDELARAGDHAPLERLEPLGRAAEARQRARQRPSFDDGDGHRDGRNSRQRDENFRGKGDTAKQSIGFAGIHGFLAPQGLRRMVGNLRP